MRSEMRRRGALVVAMAAGLGASWRAIRETRPVVTSVLTTMGLRGMRPDSANLASLPAVSGISDAPARTPPSITTTVANAMVVASHQLTNGQVWQNPPPSGMTQAFQQAAGNEMIQVSYPTNTMSQEAKLMSLRGNNRYFARATVQHELIPGHHLEVPAEDGADVLDGRTLLPDRVDVVERERLRSARSRPHTAGAQSSDQKRRETN